MTRSSHDAVREPLGRLAWRLDTPAGLAAMFAVAFVLRLADRAARRASTATCGCSSIWAARLADVGTHHFYVAGPVRRLSAGLPLRPLADRQDLGDAGLPAAQAARDPRRPRRSPGSPARSPRGSRRRRCASGGRCARSSPPAVLFNPAVIALSAGLGPGRRRAGGVRARGRCSCSSPGRQSLQREIGAFLLFAVAIAMKPQSGFVLPVMLYALYRRYLHRRAAPELIDGALSIALIGVLVARPLGRLGARVRPRAGRARPLLPALGVGLPGHERERVQPLGRARLLAERLDRATT